MKEDGREEEEAPVARHLLFLLQIGTMGRRRPISHRIRDDKIRTMRNELRFILRSVEFSICDTFRKIFSSSFSFSSDESNVDAEA